MSETESPEVLDYRNANGHGWTFYRRDGVLRGIFPHKTPAVDLEEIRHVQNLELRDDDVLVVAYSKCGTHWLWEIVMMIQNGCATHSKLKKEVAMLGMPLFERAAELPSPRVLNTHNNYHHLPRKLLEKRTKLIHIMRNPKDVSVSLYNHFQGAKPPMGFEGTYQEFTDLFTDGKVFGGSYFDYIKDWLQVEKDHPDLPILTVYYEELKKNPVKTVQSIAEFLGTPIDDELCRQITDACSFTKLKQVDKEVKVDPGKGKPSLWKDGHTGIYRKGEIGDWKNWLTVAQNEVFDDVIEREMKGTGIEFVYE